MADATDIKTVLTGGKYHVVHLQNRSDGTGETSAVKVNLGALLTFNKRVPTYCVVDRIEYMVSGFSMVKLDWDHTTPDEIATLAGSGVIDLQPAGGLVDPKSAGGTGNIILSTVGAVANASYDITLWVRLKA